MSRFRHHRWFVDGITEDVARVEIDGERVVTVPLWLLPADVREGDVLQVRHQRGEGRSRLVVERDAAATRAGREGSAAQVAGIPVAADGGGDVVL